jgi:hypothetical protein
MPSTLSVSRSSPNYNIELATYASKGGRYRTKCSIFLAALITLR